MPKTTDILSSVFRLRLGSLVYVLVIFAVIVATFVIHIRRDGIFACTANLYGGNSYLSYCGTTAYGDYDHGAFWFGLEPEAGQHAAEADVLFVGNSRLQFGFSAPALGRWFSANGLKYYLLGFSHFENDTFSGPLLRSLHPRARSYVIDVDDFFSDHASDPGNDVMYGGPNTRARYETKRNWQTIHRIVCTWQPSLCGDKIAFYRQRDTGEWQLSWNMASTRLFEPADSPVDYESVARMKPIAEKFISDLGVDRSCVFLTYVPTANHRATVSALAQALGFDLISPPLDGLQTFDGIHLEPGSAERFVRAFLEISGPRIQRCLGVDSRRVAGP
jgi:hypothetical protein